MNIFQRQPEFIDNDPRTGHSFDVGWTADLQAKRYSGWFTGMDLNGRTILDLGCCGAAVGAWVLDNGAADYTGIEISSQIADMAEQNLKKHWINGQWAVIRDSIENHLKDSNENYDIMIAAGVLHGVSDLVTFLRMAAARCDHMLIEAYHPQLHHVGWLAKNLIPHLTQDTKKEFVQLLTELEMHYPVIEVNPNGRMCLDDQQGSAANILKLAPSLAALKVIMNRLGFSPNLAAYTSLKASIPKFYGPQRRFAVMYDRTHDPIGMSYRELRSNGNVIFEPWANKQR